MSVTLNIINNDFEFTIVTTSATMKCLYSHDFTYRGQAQWKKDWKKMQGSLQHGENARVLYENGHIQLDNQYVTFFVKNTNFGGKSSIEIKVDKTLCTTAFLQAKNHF